jgi:hypothetical protein
VQHSCNFTTHPVALGFFFEKISVDKDLAVSIRIREIKEMIKKWEKTFGGLKKRTFLCSRFQNKGGRSQKY